MKDFETALKTHQDRLALEIVYQAIRICFLFAFFFGIPVFSGFAFVFIAEFVFSCSEKSTQDYGNHESRIQIIILISLVIMAMVGFVLFRLDSRNKAFGFKKAKLINYVRARIFQCQKDDKGEHP